MHEEWITIQDEIWNCTKCTGHPRVELNIRQQTDVGHNPAKLLVVAVAPPFCTGVRQKEPARSITNWSEDMLRKFVENALALTWDTLRSRGLFVLHAVKCAIVPDEDGFQNPPSGIVDVCAQRHFVKEFIALNPPIVLVLGSAARRAVLKMLDCERPAGLRLSGSLQGQYKVRHNDHDFELFVTKFPRAVGRRQAQADLKAAATRSGLIE
jgi:uracil-DNA glycosylase